MKIDMTTFQALRRLQDGDAIRLTERRVMQIRQAMCAAGKLREPVSRNVNVPSFLRRTS